jgi:hypothetical protein
MTLEEMIAITLERLRKTVLSGKVNELKLAHELDELLNEMGERGDFGASWENDPRGDWMIDEWSLVDKNIQNMH